MKKVGKVGEQRLNEERERGLVLHES